MSMRLLAADLSLGRRSFATSSTSSSIRNDSHLHHHPHGLMISNGDCLVRDDPQLFMISSCNQQPPSDLHALEVYHKALEDERLKIQAFERELPFSMQLLDDAIEASKEQLEERLSCKLNTPLHDSPTHNEFMCKYTSSSLMRGKATLTPSVGEINLHFKRKWSCLPPSSAPMDVLAPPFTTTRCLLQKTAMPPSTFGHEDTPQSTLFEGCIKLRDGSIGDSIPPDQAVNQNIHKTSLMFRSSTKPMDSIHPASYHLHTTNAMHLKSMATINSEQTSSDMEAGRMLDCKVDDIVSDHNKKSNCIQASPASRSINAPARLIHANLISSSSSIYPRSISITELAREEIHINTALTSTSLAKTNSLGSSNTNTLQPGGVQRKPRRCWSPELHQRFLSALNHLGGCQVATPKQIRELMNVEGLTNDEVKSHLQKFRLHMRRPNGVIANSAQSTPPQTTGHHLVVFGHIWVPPEYATGEQHATSASLNMHNISEDFPDSEYGSSTILEQERSGVVKSLTDHRTLFRSTHSFANNLYCHDERAASVSPARADCDGQVVSRQCPLQHHQTDEAVDHSHNHLELQQQLNKTTPHAIPQVATKISEQTCAGSTAENGDAFANHDTDIVKMSRHCHISAGFDNNDNNDDLQRMQHSEAELSTTSTLQVDVNVNGEGAHSTAGAGGVNLYIQDGAIKPLLHLLHARDDAAGEAEPDETADNNVTVGHNIMNNEETEHA